MEKLILNQDKLVTFSAVIQEKTVTYGGNRGSGKDGDNDGDGDNEGDEENKDEDNGNAEASRSEEKDGPSSLPAFPPITIGSGRMFFDSERARNVPVDENIRGMKDLWSGEN